ncbi:lysophospholipid acyltransferase family protein [Neptunicoccus cionae]|uniref:lysophospholipid acyltransferase family protein n=1 Tax=Neptunicoccus cionae TaxID=2035344 RepID=UPI000C75819E|nr:lysophospholipid acyltransferase family protein [Amylibacter cionae]PLS20535.1 acyltransferase [Amylibacter cionae]
MNQQISGAQDISYATSVPSKAGQVVIRTVETLTGRNRLLRMAQGYDSAVQQGEDFWQVIARSYGLRLDVIGGSLENIPKTGPLILIANHPYGILDGLVLGNILSRTRGDFRFMAHRVFCKSAELDRVILPINFDGTREAVQENLATRKTALSYLGQGGAIGIFPGGTVSTAPRPFARPLDPRWRSFTAKLIAKTNATVVPVYFDGANSRLFQIASHLNYTLRMSLLINEFRRARKEPVRLVVGEPLKRSDLDVYSKDARGMMDFLRESTYSLSPKPVPRGGYGFEFEDNHR